MKFHDMDFTKKCQIRNAKNCRKNYIQFDENNMLSCFINDVKYCNYIISNEDMESEDWAYKEQSNNECFKCPKRKCCSFPPSFYKQINKTQEEKVKMKFHELDLSKKIRHKEWVCEHYASWNEGTMCIYDSCGIPYREMRFEKKEIESNGWEYLEEKKYQVIYKREDAEQIEISNYKYKSTYEYKEKMGSFLNGIEWAYLIDENGDKVI